MLLTKLILVRETLLDSFILKNDITNVYSYNSTFYNQKEIEDIKRNHASNRNIYFIIADGMTSIDEFVKQSKRVQY